MAGRCQIGRPLLQQWSVRFYRPPVIMATSDTYPAVTPVDKYMMFVCFVESEKLSCFSAVNSKKQFILAESDVLQSEFQSQFLTTQPFRSSRQNRPQLWFT
jgi:hypothetical protein